MESICFINEEPKLSMVMSLRLFPPIGHKYMKEPIKMHVEFSFLYKTLSIIEMRSKIFKAKGGAAV